MSISDIDSLLETVEKRLQLLNLLKLVKQVQKYRNNITQLRQKLEQELEEAEYYCHQIMGALHRQENPRRHLYIIK